MDMEFPKYDFIKGSLFKLFINFKSESCILINAVREGCLAPQLARHAKLIVVYCNDYKESQILKDYLIREKIENAGIVVGSLDAWPFRDHIFDIACLGRLYCSRLLPALSEIKRTLNIAGQAYLYDILDRSDQFIKRCMSQRSFLRSLKKTGLVRNAAIEHYPNLFEARFLKTISSGAPRFSGSQIKDSIKLFLNKGIFGGIYLHSGNKTKSKRGRSMLEGIRVQLESDTGLRLRGADLIWVGTEDGVVADYGAAIARLPQSPLNLKRCERNFETLEKLEKKKLPIIVPKALNRGDYQGQPYYAESKIIGASIDLNPPTEKQMVRLYEEALGILTSPDFILGQINESEFNLLIDKEVQGLTPFIAENDKNIMLSSIDVARSILLSCKIPMAVHHGDFKCSNFICDKNRHIYGIIDWDLSRIPGFPLLDLFTLHYSFLYYTRNKKTEFKLTYEELLDNIINNPQHLKFADIFKIFNIPVEQAPIIALLAQLYYVNNHYYIRHKQTREWYEGVVQKHFIPSCKKIQARYNSRMTACG
jgi:hypothetical protein